MKRIVVAADFSPGADRAIRRAVFLAKPWHARIILAHVLDERRSREERGEAERLLERLAQTVREWDGVECEFRIAAGRTPDRLAELISDVEGDLVVTGPARREALRNLFLGTTAGRTVGAANPPFIVAAGLPTGPYRQALFATDLSLNSASAALAAQRLGLLTDVRTAAALAFSAPAEGLLIRANVGWKERAVYVAQEALEARKQLGAFLATNGIPAEELFAELIHSDAAEAIRTVARRLRADLIVIGARGGGALESILLGSVATELLAASELDVLVAPPNAFGLGS